MVVVWACAGLTIQLRSSSSSSRKTRLAGRKPIESPNRCECQGPRKIGAIILLSVWLRLLLTLRTYVTTLPCRETVRSRSAQILKPEFLLHSCGKHYPMQVLYFCPRPLVVLIVTGGVEPDSDLALLNPSETMSSFVFPPWAVIISAYSLPSPNAMVTDSLSLRTRWQRPNSS